MAGEGRCGTASQGRGFRVLRLTRNTGAGTLALSLRTTETADVTVLCNEGGRKLCTNQAFRGARVNHSLSVVASRRDDDRANVTTSATRMAVKPLWLGS